MEQEQKPAVDNLIVRTVGALEQLVELKALKDKLNGTLVRNSETANWHGEYTRRQPAAWTEARAVIQLWENGGQANGSEAKSG